MDGSVHPPPRPQWQPCVLRGLLALATCIGRHPCPAAPGGEGVKWGRQEAQLPTCPSSGPGSAPRVTTCPAQSPPPHPCPRPIHPACTLRVQQGLGVSRGPALLCMAGSRPGRAWISGVSEDPRRLRGEPAVCSCFPSKPVPLQRSGEDPPPTHTLCLPWGAPSRRQSHLSNLSRRGTGLGG